VPTPAPTSVCEYYSEQCDLCECPVTTAEASPINPKAQGLTKGKAKAQN
jgi:hypothetical protein